MKTLTLVAISSFVATSAVSAQKAPDLTPYLMFYHDRAFKPTTFGAGGFTAPIIDGSAGDPNSPIQVIYIPVRNWSDGTAAVHVASAK